MLANPGIVRPAADLVLAKIRSHTHAEYERYTKYYLAGAWAGAVLFLGNKAIEVSFDSSEAEIPLDPSNGYQWAGLSTHFRVVLCGEADLVRRCSQVVPDFCRQAIEEVSADPASAALFRSFHA